MNKKVTIQDIADALGISRNTVSKAINNSDGISELTKEKVLQKAIEMGYKQFSYISSLASIMSEETETEIKGNISLFITSYVSYSHFASTLIDKIHKEITDIGYTLTIYRVSKDNIRDLTLPKSFLKENTQAILCVEIFDAAYADMICGLNMPVLFVDGPARRNERSVQADLLMMDNTSEITRFVNLMVSGGLKKIGFIGDYEHCQSFWERYISYRMALTEAGGEFDERFVIKYFDRVLDNLAEKLEVLEEMPDVFICANDFVATDVMRFLSMKDEGLLKKVRILGFDDSHESRIVYPPLSTVHIHSQVMAFSALHLLMTRIKEPTMEYRTIYVATDLVLRESTEF